MKAIIFPFAVFAALSFVVILPKTAQAKNLIVATYSSFDEKINAIQTKLVKRLRKEMAEKDVQILNIDAGQNINNGVPFFGRKFQTDSFDHATFLIDTHGSENAISKGLVISAGDKIIDLDSREFLTELANFAPNAKSFSLILLTCHAGAIEISDFPKPLTVFGGSPADAKMSVIDLEVFLMNLKHLGRPIPTTAMNWYEAWYNMAKTNGEAGKFGEIFQIYGDPHAVYDSDSHYVSPFWLGEFEPKARQFKVVKGVKSMVGYKGHDPMFKALIQTRIRKENEGFSGKINCRGIRNGSLFELFDD